MRISGRPCDTAADPTLALVEHRLARQQRGGMAIGPEPEQGDVEQRPRRIEHRRAIGRLQGSAHSARRPRRECHRSAPGEYFPAAPAPWPASPRGSSGSCSPDDRRERSARRPNTRIRAAKGSARGTHRRPAARRASWGSSRRRATRGRPPGPRAPPPSSIRRHARASDTGSGSTSMRPIILLMSSPQSDEPRMKRSTALAKPSSL